MGKIVIIASVYPDLNVKSNNTELSEIYLEHFDDINHLVNFDNIIAF